MFAFWEVDVFSRFGITSFFWKLYSLFSTNLNCWGDAWGWGFAGVSSFSGVSVLPQNLCPVGNGLLSSLSLGLSAPSRCGVPAMGQHLFRLCAHELCSLWLCCVHFRIYLLSTDCARGGLRCGRRHGDGGTFNVEMGLGWGVGSWNAN